MYKYDAPFPGSLALTLVQPTRHGGLFFLGVASNITGGEEAQITEAREKRDGSIFVVRRHPKRSKMIRNSI